MEGWPLPDAESCRPSSTFQKSPRIWSWKGSKGGTRAGRAPATRTPLSPPHPACWPPPSARDPSREARARAVASASRDHFSRRKTLRRSQGRARRGAGGGGRRAPRSGPRAGHAARLAEQLVPVEHRLPLLLHLQLPPLLGALHAPQDAAGPGGPAGGRSGSRGSGVLQEGGRGRVCLHVPAPRKPSECPEQPRPAPHLPKEGLPRAMPAVPRRAPGPRGPCLWVCRADPARPGAQQGQVQEWDLGPGRARPAHPGCRHSKGTLSVGLRTSWGQSGGHHELHQRPPGQQAGQAGAAARLGAAQLGAAQLRTLGEGTWSHGASGRRGPRTPTQSLLRPLHAAGRPPLPPPLLPAFCRQGGIRPNYHSPR